MESLLKEAKNFIDTDSKGRRKAAPTAHTILGRARQGNVYCNLVSLADNLELDEQQMKEEDSRHSLDVEQEGAMNEYLELIDARYEALFLI